ATRRVQIVTQNLSALHHEFHALKFCDVGQRIPTYGHQIGELSALDRTDGAVPSHHLRIHNGRSANNLRRGHPKLDHVPKFPGLRTVGKCPTPVPKPILTPAATARRKFGSDTSATVRPPYFFASCFRSNW